MTGLRHLDMQARQSKVPALPLRVLPLMRGELGLPLGRETGLVPLLSPSAQGGHPCLAEENQRLLVGHPIIGGLLPTLLASSVLAVRWQSLALLLQLTQTEHGRALIVSHLDLTR